MLSGMQARLCAIMFASLLAGCYHGEKFCRGAQAGQTKIQLGKNTEGKMMNGDAIYPAVTQADLTEKVKAGAITLIDANGSESYAEGHIPGSLDFESLASKLPQDFPKDRNSPIVVYCGGPRCGAWRGAAMALTEEGYTRISHFPGGLMEWTEAGMPLEKGSAPATTQEIPSSEDLALIPSCKLSPQAQANRIGSLRSGLFKAIDSVIVGPGSLRFQFPDTPKNLTQLTQFIRTERECCTALRFGLEWEPEGGPVTLEMKGPADLLAALKEVANTSR